MSVLIAQSEGSISRGGKGVLLFMQLKKNTDGTFVILPSGNDNLGDAAGTVHVAGSQTKTDYKRDDTGIQSLDTNIVEMDKDHKNMLLHLAPASSSTSSKTIPDLTLETGVQLAGGASAAGDSTLPYFGIVYFPAEVDDLDTPFFAVAQFKRATQITFDQANWSTYAISLSTVDANGFTVPTDDVPEDFADLFDGVTSPALTGDLAFGCFATEV